MVGVCEGGSLGDGPLTLRCLSCGLPNLYEAFGWMSIWYKGKHFFKFCFYFTIAHFHGIVCGNSIVAGGDNVQ